jgi:hypothetical protein
MTFDDEEMIREAFEMRVRTLMRRSAPLEYIDMVLERRPDGRYVQIDTQRKYRHFKVGFETGYAARARDDALKGLKKAK